MMIFRRQRAAFALVLAALVPGTALAEPSCDISRFDPANPTFQKAVVSAEKGQRAYFHDGGDHCPSAACRRKAYVIAGDKMLIADTSAEWACAAFVGAKGAIFGWVEKRLLAMTPAHPNPPLGNWGGEWHNGSNSLNIRVQDDRSLDIDGSALWDNGPSPHTGAAQGTTTPTGRSATITDDSCQIALTLADDWLVAQDNNQCGGLNVTFSGVYRR